MVFRTACSILAAALALLMSSCARPREPVSSPPAGNGAGHGPNELEICLRNHIGIYGYAYDELLERTRGIDQTPCVARLTQRDVVAYRVSDKPSGQVELLLTPEASSRVARVGEGMYQDVCEEGLFTVALDGQPLYRGQCYLRIGAAALDYPVLHIEPADGRRVALRIGSRQGAWVGRGPGEGTAAARMDPPALRELFRRLGRLETAE